MGRIVLSAVLLAGLAATALAQTDDGSLTARIAAAGDSSRWEGAGIVVVLDSTDVDVEPTGLGHVRATRVVKILTEEGAREQATQRFDYDPASNWIRIEAILIHRAQGGIEEIDPAGAVDLFAPANMIYWGARMKIISLPRLRIGDAVETRTYKKGFTIAYLDDRESAQDERYIPPMRGHFYDVPLFQEHAPIRSKIYAVRVPRDKPLQYAVYNGDLRSALAFDDSTFVYTFEARDVPAYEGESYTPDNTDLLPKVVMATLGTWQEKSRWFFDINDEILEPDGAIREKVAALTRGLRTDEEKMAVLLHWVAQEIRYSGLSMGKGEGYTLHPGKMSYEDRCGVCKDIAGMLVTMLRAAGFPTYPVMTNAGSRVEAVPADQFNHCVVAVERSDGSYTMLDPTWAPFDRDVWSHYEGEQHFVIGSPRGEKLDRIRTFRPDENRMSIENRARLASDGTLEGDLTIKGIGASGARLRGRLADAPAADRGIFLANLLRPLGRSIEIGSYKLTEPRDFARDAIFEIHYRVPRYAVVGDSAIGFVPPAARLVANSSTLCRLLAFTKPEEERKYDALLWFAQELKAHDVVDLPKGFRPPEPPRVVEVDRPAGTLRVDFRVEKGRLVGDLVAVSKKRTVPADEWAGGAEAADSLRAAGDRFAWVRRGR